MSDHGKFLIPKPFKDQLNALLRKHGLILIESGIIQGNKYRLIIEPEEKPDRLSAKR